MGKRKVLCASFYLGFSWKVPLILGVGLLTGIKTTPQLKLPNQVLLNYGKLTLKQIITYPV